MAFSSSFIVTEATIPDVRSVFNIQEVAFKDGPFRRALYPTHLAHLTSPEYLLRWRVNKFTEGAYDNQTVALKAVSHDEASGVDRIAGFAYYHMPHYRWDKSQAKQQNEVQNTARANSELTSTETSPPLSPQVSELPACLDPNVLTSQRKATTQMRKDTWGDDTNFWYLAALSVHPDFQRRGVGSMLLGWGLARADEDGVPMYLEASPIGKLLYESKGFDVVGHVELLDGAYAITGMRRMPVAEKGL